MNPAADGSARLSPRCFVGEEHGGYEAGCSFGDECEFLERHLAREHRACGYRGNGCRTGAGTGTTAGAMTSAGGTTAGVVADGESDWLTMTATAAMPTVVIPPDP